MGVSRLPERPLSVCPTSLTCDTRDVFLSQMAPSKEDFPLEKTDELPFFKFYPPKDSVEIKS
jgi:hypothetical protein